ncbi:MAG: hypothetical protein ACRDQ4_22600 [Pseudonocardiaceae bacterium]
MSFEHSDRWRDAGDRHIPVGCRVEQVEVAAGWGAWRSRLSARGRVIGCRRARLLVRFDGELGWVRVRPGLVRVLADEQADRPPPGIEHVIAALEELRARLPASTKVR